MKVLIEKIENGYLVKEFNSKGDVDTCYAYTYDSNNNDDILGTQVRAAQHIAWLIRGYNKFSEKNLKVIVDLGHKLKDEDL